MFLQSFGLIPTPAFMNYKLTEARDCDFLTLQAAGSNTCYKVQPLLLWSWSPVIPLSILWFATRWQAGPQCHLVSLEEKKPRGFRFKCLEPLEDPFEVHESNVTNFSGNGNFILHFFPDGGTVRNTNKQDKGKDSLGNLTGIA